MAVAFVTGMQGNHPHYLKVVSTPTHYAMHSGPEPERHAFDARVSEYDLIGWNIRQAGPIWVPTPELRPEIDAANDPIAFRLMAAPADSITVSATLVWEEM